MLGGDHCGAAHFFRDGRGDPAGLGAHGVRQTAADFRHVAAALFRDTVFPAFLLNVVGFHQLRQAIGVVEIADAVVTKNQLRQGLRVHRGGELIENIEDQDFDIQLLVDKSKAIHTGSPHLTT